MEGGSLLAPLATRVIVQDQGIEIQWCTGPLWLLHSFMPLLSPRPWLAFCASPHRLWW